MQAVAHQMPPQAGLHGISFLDPESDGVTPWDRMAARKIRVDAPVFW
jgi:hypothetical protein